METDQLLAKSDPQTEELEKIELKPKKTNVTVQLLALVWAPFVNGQRAF
jgi:hypothetical protein